jgi:hypothetical protein
MNVIKKTNKTGKYYIYTHYRLDKNEIFYIGIGVKYQNSEYGRAKSKKRNNIWYSIVKKTNYIIEILDEDDDYDFIKQKEISLIKKYGKIINNNGGILSNMADGGQGHLGYVDYRYTKKVYLYHSTGEFFKEYKSYAECSRELGLKTSIHQSVDKNHLIKGYIAKSFKVDRVEPVLNIKEKLKKRLSKKVYQYDLNYNLIKEWTSSSEAGRILKIQSSHIREMCNGSTRYKKVGGYIWSYKLLFNKLNNEDVPV